MIQGSLEPTGDASLEDAKAVIDLLALAKRYRSGPNSVGVGKTMVTVFRWCLSPALVAMIVTIVVQASVGRPLTRYGDPVLYWGTTALSVLALVLCAINVVTVLALLLIHRKQLTENDAHHLRSGYLLHERQVRQIAVYPLTVLHSVSRYFQQRPLSGRSVHLSFLGKGELTLATVALVLTSVKQLYDLHAFGMSANGDLVFLVWLSLLALIYVSVLMRWFARKEDYQKGLLIDAIAMLTERDGKAPP